MQNEKKVIKVVLPKGVFCGNCSDCRHSGRKDSDGRIECDVGYGKNYPQDRNGCFKYERS